MNGATPVLSGVFANRYALERELGEGGTAIVYLARDLQRGHAVAIKVLRAELSQSVGQARFLKEIQLSQRLHHPNLLPVLDSGSFNEHTYFVLPHMEGGTLRTRLLQEKQLSLPETLAITRSISLALAHAHERGLVHRDVKPENILFTSGQACLADFGIARALERSIDETTTSTNLVRGTPPYMSPEQASGEVSYDGRSDLYSLACVVYEMLAGMPPFVGPTPQSVIAQRLTHPPRPVRVYRPALPAAVEGVLARALMIAPADRFQTASEFFDALEAAASSPDSTTALVSPSRRWGWERVAAGAGVLAIAASAALWAASRPERDPGTIPGGDPRRLAILYFANLSPAAVSPHVVDGVTEDLIDQLGGVSALHVISPTGVRQFRDHAVSLDSIGRSLNVGTIVSGSIARAGDTMHIHVRLADARTGRQIFSQSIAEPWTEVLTLQRKLANQVAFFLRQRIGEEVAVRERRSGTRSYLAWETAQLATAELRRAVDAVRQRPTPPPALNFVRADSIFSRAELIDPQWAYPTIRRGHIALGLATQSAIAQQWTPPPPGIDSATYVRFSSQERRGMWLHRALALSNQALSKAARSAEALALRGETFYRLASGVRSGSDTLARNAEADLRSAIASRPHDANAWATLASVASDQGRFADAADAAERAYEADAFFEVRRIVSAGFFAALHSERFDDAQRWCALGLQHYSGDPRFVECELSLLGWRGTRADDVQRAERLLRTIERRDSLRMLEASWGYRRLMLAAVLARAGKADSARAILRAVRSENVRTPSRRIHPQGMAYVHLLLGEPERTLAHLEDYLRASPQARPQIAQHPWFRPLINDPRFRRLVGGTLSAPD